MEDKTIAIDSLEKIISLPVQVLHSLSVLVLAIAILLLVCKEWRNQ